MNRTKCIGIDRYIVLSRNNMPRNWDESSCIFIDVCERSLSRRIRNHVPDGFLNRWRPMSAPHMIPWRTAVRKHEFIDSDSIFFFQRRSFSESTLNVTFSCFWIQKTTQKSQKSKKSKKWRMMRRSCFRLLLPTKRRSRVIKSAPHMIPWRTAVRKHEFILTPIPFSFQRRSFSSQCWKSECYFFVFLDCCMWWKNH